MLKPRLMSTPGIETSSLGQRTIAGLGMRKAGGDGGYAETIREKQ